MQKRSIFAALAAVAITATAAYAAVTFDPTTGTGFVGKGDVQLAFGWNNATAQKEAKNVTFTYDAITTYDVTIEFDAGRSSVHQIITQQKSTGVQASIQSDPRKTGQYTGWNLIGLGGTVVTGDALPNVGDSCPNGGPDSGCIVTAVSVVPEASTGGLLVHWNGLPAQLQ
jgi:hypothetical protein